MRTFSAKKLVVIESGHLSETLVSGGDLLMQGMAPYLKRRGALEVIIPSMARHHWKAEKGITFQMIPPVFFEKSTSHIAVFLTYLWRMSHVVFFLLKKEGPFVLYSSTNTFVDVVPAYLTQIFRKDIDWIARVHHLTELPTSRPGSFFVNTVSLALDRTSLYFIKSARLVIALNTSLQNTLIKKGVPKKKVKVLGAGIDAEKIDSQKVLGNTKSYDGIFLGRLHPTKGIVDLIPIWKSVVKEIPEARLAVIGGGQEYVSNDLQQRIQKNGLTKNVALLGFVPDEKVFSLMKKAKVFLFTDHEAGWGLAVAEAMACGLPVVGYDTGVLGTVYKKGFRKVPLGKYDNFSQNVIQLLKNKYQRIKLAKAARLEAAKLDWTVTSKKFDHMVEKLLQSQSKNT